MIDTRIYFIQCGDGGPVKIGYAMNFEKRIADMQVSNWQELRVVATIVGTPKQEKEWHDRFRGCRIRGEWFWPVPALLSAIETAVEDDADLGEKAPYTSPLRELLGMPPKELEEIS